MNVVNIVALLCAVAGCLVIVVGFVLSLSRIEEETEIKRKASDTRGNLQQAKEVVNKMPERQGAGYGLQMQSASSALNDAVEGIKELIGLTRNLRELTPALKASGVATVLFFLALILATAGRVIP